MSRVEFGQTLPWLEDEGEYHVNLYYIFAVLPFFLYFCHLNEEGDNDRYVGDGPVAADGVQWQQG